MIYSEALPILYGQNAFEFSSANAIRSFQSKSLIGYPLGRVSRRHWCHGFLDITRLTNGDQVAFNLKLAPMGRLTLLRSVIIILNAEYRWHSPIGVNGTRAPNRDHIWRDWYVLEQFLSMQTALYDARFVLSAKGSRYPIKCLFAHVLARGSAVDSGIFTGLQHCSARATTCVLGVAETDVRICGTPYFPVRIKMGVLRHVLGLSTR